MGPSPQGEQTANMCAIIEAMLGSRCRVSFTDSDGVLHGVDVDAESLYEAVAIAVAQFRDNDVSSRRHDAFSMPRLIHYLSCSSPFFGSRSSHSAKFDMFA